MAEMMNTWEAIREGANDVERLIGQKQYNLAMIKARQTLEIMVRTLAEKNGIQITDLAAVIDELYHSGVISQTTAEHYHKIRMIGNKAAHEGDENPSGANSAYHLLSQELYTFAKDFAPGSGSGRRYRSGMSAGYSGVGSGQGSGAGQSAASASQGRGTSSRNNRSIDERNVRRVSHRTSRKSALTPELIFKIMIPVLVIVLVIGCIVLVKNKKKEKPVETEPELQTIVETKAPETERVTEPPTERETVMIYTVIPDVLNVRSQPTTDSEKLGKVRKGETLSFISDYDSEWALINFNDQEGYVNKQYVDVRSVDLAEYQAESEGTINGEDADAQ